VSEADRRDDAELAREVAERAIRRLNVLEHLFLLVAAGAALLAGLLVAWLLSQSAGAPFRATWAVSALVLFLVPAGMSSIRVRREEREWQERRADAARLADAESGSKPDVRSDHTT
jgi:uncharacterized membrane protein